VTNYTAALPLEASATHWQLHTESTRKAYSQFWFKNKQIYI